jgi:hypothetical protein
VFVAGGGAKGNERRPKRLTTEAAKSVFIEEMGKGVLINAALDKIGYARKSYEYWRRTDSDFKARVDQARALRQPDKDTVRGERLPFAEFRRKYLKTETFWHQHQIIDILEGREPRDLHDAQTYSLARKNRILVNIPPFHAKSMTVTVDYSVYRLCMDPSFRILIVSAGSVLAADFLYAIKQRLTSPDFIDLQKAYAPDGGWEQTAESWTENRIIFGNDVRSEDGGGHEKDPNVQAVGMRSKIYGKRANLIILDDAVDGTNVSEYKKQMTWLRREVSSRLEAGGKLLVLGTRIAPVDLYSELMNPSNYANQKVPWTHFASPAILEEAVDYKDHVTLWPYATQPWVKPGGEDLDECLCETECGASPILKDGLELYPRWDGTHLEMGPRAENNNTEWALVYQQQSVSEDATFPEHAVRACTNGTRQPGLLQANKAGHPYKGMHGLYVLHGVDPSIKGFAGHVVYAVDRETEKRYILTAWNQKAPTKKQLEDKMKEIALQYGVHEVRVEKTGLLQFFTQDATLRQWYSTRGIRFTEHHTGSNKWDASYGVSSLASLFGEYDKAWDNPGGEWRCITEPLIELPRTQNSDGLKALQHQLIIWTPDLDPGKVPCDMVMALWFAEVGAREHLGHGRGNVTSLFGRSNKFVSPRRAAQTQRVNLADYRAPGL